MPGFTRTKQKPKQVTDGSKQVQLFSPAAMVVVSVTLHPQGLSPQEAGKAWYLRVKQKKTWPEVSAECVNLQGQPAGDKAVRDAVARMKQRRGKGQVQVGKGRYKNCGRRWGKDGEKYKLSQEPMLPCAKRHRVREKNRTIILLLSKTSRFPLLRKSSIPK